MSLRPSNPARLKQVDIGELRKQSFGSGSHPVAPGPTRRVPPGVPENFFFAIYTIILISSAESFIILSPTSLLQKESSREQYSRQQTESDGS